MPAFLLTFPLGVTGILPGYCNSISAYDSEILLYVSISNVVSLT